MNDTVQALIAFLTVANCMQNMGNCMLTLCVSNYERKFAIRNRKNVAFEI